MQELKIYADPSEAEEQCQQEPVSFYCYCTYSTKVYCTFCYRKVQLV